MAQTNILLESGTGEFELVEFHLDEINAKGEVYRGNYGINVAKVLEILRVPELTRLPETAHPAVLGAFDYRGRVVPVVDLALWLKKDKAPAHDPRVMICEFNKVVSAFLVSAVSRIHRVSWAALEQADAGAGGGMAGHAITGVVRLEKRLILMLDMEHILAQLNPDQGMALDPEAWSAPGAAKGRRALVAEDSPGTRHLLAGLLAQAGFEVVQCPDGGQALDKLTAMAARAEAESRPLSDFVDVVVTDIEMPVLDGLTLTRRIREHKELRRLPVILFSSLITEAQRHKGLSVGADDQIAKPEVTKLAVRALQLIEARAASPSS